MTTAPLSTMQSEQSNNERSFVRAPPVVLLTVEVTFVVVAAVIVLTAPVAPASAVVRLVRPVQPLTSAEKVAPVELMVAVGIPVTVMPAANAVPETFAFNTVLALEFPVSLSNAVSESIVPALNV